MTYLAWHGFCISFDDTRKADKVMQKTGKDRGQKWYDRESSFLKQKRKELSVPDEVHIRALKYFFKHLGDVEVERTPIHVDKEKGIDFYVKTSQGALIGIDSKVRKTENRMLTLEVEWLNVDRKAWLHATKADYFLFVHEAKDKGGYDCYLVKADDARRLVAEVAPRGRRGWRDPGVAVAVIYYYHYHDLARIGAIAEHVFVRYKQL